MSTVLMLTLIACAASDLPEAPQNPIINPVALAAVVPTTPRIRRVAHWRPNNRPGPIGWPPRGWKRIAGR